MERYTFIKPTLKVSEGLGALLFSERYALIAIDDFTCDLGDVDLKPEAEDVRGCRAKVLGRILLVDFLSFGDDVFPSPDSVGVNTAF